MARQFQLTGTYANRISPNSCICNSITNSRRASRVLDGRGERPTGVDGSLLAFSRLSLLRIPHSPRLAHCGSRATASDFPFQPSTF